MKGGKQTGMEAMKRLRFLAPGTGEREGGEKTQPCNPSPSQPVMSGIITRRGQNKHADRLLSASLTTIETHGGWKLFLETFTLASLVPIFGILR